MVVVGSVALVAVEFEGLDEVEPATERVVVEFEERVVV